MPALALAGTTDLLHRVVDKLRDLFDGALRRELHRWRERRREQLVLVAEGGDKLVVDGVDDDGPLGRLEPARMEG
jgi:hypothetical protein